nr:MAG TPA: hypothetical protein [Caudoviricetes sp.]
MEFFPCNFHCSIKCEELISAVNKNSYLISELNIIEEGIGYRNTKLRNLIFVFFEVSSDIFV